MAITKMKHISLLGLKDDKEILMTAMQRIGCVQVTDAPSELDHHKPEESSDTQHLEKQLTRIAWAIDRMKKYDTAGKGMFGSVPTVTQTKVDQMLLDMDTTLETVSELESIAQRLGEMKGIEARLQAQLQQAEPWLSFDITPTRMKASKYAKVFLGTISTQNVEEITAFITGKPVEQFTISTMREDTGMAYIVHESVCDEMEQKLAQVGFTNEALAFCKVDETPKAAKARFEQQVCLLEKEGVQIEKQLQKLAEVLPQLKILHDELSIKMVRASTATKSIETASAFFLNGWIPENLAEKAKAKLTKISPTCSIELRDPEDNEEPPVSLENDRFSTPFESVVEGFALPAYRGFDPTAIMAPFYACLFGMMLSDAGYGLLMALLIPVFIKVKKIKLENAKLMYVLKWGGVATVIWGVIYNTFFGFNLLPKNLWLLDPVSNSMVVMGVCLAVGALHVFVGLGIAAYVNIKRGDLVSAISDQFSWALLLSGLGLLIVPPLATVGTVMAILGAGIILVMAGRENKNPFSRLISGLGALYGITSWVSDLLSYMRLFGMGLATGVVGMVFNILIGMVWENGPIGVIFGIILFIACHGFNLGINALGAYVHSCRLQYIEFFGKFYEEGGKPFTPLTTKTKYVSIEQDATEM